MRGGADALDYYYWAGRPSRQDRVKGILLRGKECLDGGPALAGLPGDGGDVIIVSPLAAILNPGALASAPLAASGPGSGAEDRFPIDLQPISDLDQSLLLDHGYPTIGGRAHVQQQVAASADDVRERQDQLTGGVVVGQRELAIMNPVIPEGPALVVVRAGPGHGAVFLPGMAAVGHAWGELGGVEPAVLVTAALAPAIIHHDLRRRGFIIEPREELTAPPE